MSYEKAKSKHPHFIGIDPPEGMAVWCTEEKKFHTIKTSTFWEIIDSIEALSYSGPVMVIIENPAVNKPIFHKAGVANAKAASRIAQNVGANKQTATAMIEFLKLRKIPHRVVAPLKGILKKWKEDKELFEQMTKYIQPTSSHGRDAAALVFGR